MSSVLATAASIAATSSAIASAAIEPSSGGLSSFVETVVPSVVATLLPSSATTTAAATTGAVTIPAYAELLAAFAGALAGAAQGVDRRFDMVGITTLAIVTGLGGGIIRDVLLQDYGIYAFMHPTMLVSCLIAAMFGFFFIGAYRTMHRPLLLIDAVSLGLFAVIGADKALLASLALIPAILLGTITSVGGGVLRDILSGEQPKVMQRGQYYATAAAAGATTYVLLVGWLNVVKPLGAALAFAVVLGLRLLSLVFGWSSPTPVDLTPGVVGAGRAALHFMPGISTTEDDQDPEDTTG